MRPRLDTTVRWSRPLRWAGGLALCAAIAAIALWVHLYEFAGINSWDAALYLTISKLLGRGLLLYRDVWEQKPPGIFAYQSGVFSILPAEVWAVRLTDYLLYVITGVVYFRLCSIEARWPLALIGTGVWLFLAHHPTFNNWGFYTEEYSSMGAIAAVAAAVHYLRHGGLWWAAASGAGIALAALFKHPGAACAVPAALLVSGRRPLRALPVLALAAALPIALVVGYFWLRGTLDEFLDCNVYQLFAYGGYTQPGGVDMLGRLQKLVEQTQFHLRQHTLLVWCASFGAIVCLLRPTRFRLAALAWLLVDLLMVAAQKHYFEHYYIQVFASGVLVSVLGFAWLLQPRPREPALLSVVRLVAALVLIGLAWPHVRTVWEARRAGVTHAWALLWQGPSAWPRAPGGATEAELGQYLRERTAPDDTILVYDTGTAVAVYWWADRTPASRYPWAAGPQSSAERSREQIAELERNRPAYILVVGGPGKRPISPVLEAHYAMVEEKWGGYRVEVWRRRDLADTGNQTGAIAPARSRPAHG